MRQELEYHSHDFSPIEIKSDKNICPKEVQSLYMSVGWQYRDTMAIKESLQNSLLVISAWEDNHLVGVGRATGDGVFNATIWDFAVKKSHQNLGIGKLILNSMVTKLDACGIPLITLYTAYTKKNFYSKLGFEFNLEHVFGMYRYNK